MKNYQNNFIDGIGNTPLIKLKAASEINNIIQNRCDELYWDDIVKKFYINPNLIKPYIFL